MIPMLLFVAAAAWMHVCMGLLVLKGKQVSRPVAYLPVVVLTLASAAIALCVR
jgi:hypothetical protein